MKRIMGHVLDFMSLPSLSKPVEVLKGIIFVGDLSFFKVPINHLALFR
jgi:hypothetical protein